jgi:hypothetical protein
MSFPQDHLSYRLHRRQMWTQILLPILLSVILFIAIIVLTSLATFRGYGDVSRWAAISTIWLVMPIMVVSLILLVLLCAVIYLLARLIGVIPPYSHQAQRFVYRIEGFVRHGSEMIVKPALFVDAIKMQIKKAAERV